MLACKIYRQLPKSLSMPSAWRFSGIATKEGVEILYKIRDRDGQIPPSADTSAQKNTPDIAMK